MRLGTLAMGIGLSRASGLGAKGFLQRERRLLWPVDSLTAAQHNTCY
jgi:hypothetical protein